MDERFKIIKEGKVLVDHGPITMVIESGLRGEPYTYAAVVGANKALELLEGLAEELHVAKKYINEIGYDQKNKSPLVLKKMIESVEQLDESDFTPMASVAGTFSDLVKAKVFEAGADYVVVNNGGDISYQMPHNREYMRIGIISDLSGNKPTHVIRIKGSSEIHGVATSGFGGRSLTKGIASAVTVLAATGSLADAAATSIANATYCEDASIERCMAEELDYDTDIRGAVVTKNIGDIKQENIEIAVRNGLKRAKALFEKKVILGAVIFLKDHMAVYPENSADFAISAIY